MSAARTQVLHAAMAGCLAAVLLSAGAAAQTTAAWPVKPVTVVIPFAPGGTTDIQARIVAAGLSSRLGQSVLPRNMPGATYKDPFVDKLFVFV